MTDSLGAVRRLSELMRRVNSSSDTDDVLEEIVHGVVDVLGYGVAAIARLEGDSLIMSHVAAPDEVVAQLVGRRTPAARILDEYQQADRWGILRYVPRGRMSPERLRAAWVPDIEPGEGEDAWHPEDALYAPLYSGTGELLGNMAVDMPPHNRIPDGIDRELLEMFVVQAGLALSRARERDRLAERVRLVEMLNRISGAGSTGDLTGTLRLAMVTVTETLGAAQAWVRCFPDAGRGIEHGAGYPRPLEPDEDIYTLRHDLVRADVVGEPVELGVKDTSSPILVESRRDLQEILCWMGADRVVVVPVAVQGDLLGYAVLAFRDKRLSSGERIAMAELGRELGRIVQQARVLETEQRLVSELRELARYRSELIATISHELRTPLTSILGHAELIEERDPASASAGAILRNAARLDRLVTNLLEYSRLQAARGVPAGEVDMVEVCAASTGLLAIRAAQVGVVLEVVHPGEPVVVIGDSEELGRVVDNLVDNAVKYTPTGGQVTVTVEKDAQEMRVVVTDTGLGIAPADLSKLFSAFSRSTDPTVLSIPGTGLGLPIAQRIAQSHGGDIHVASTPGVGSTFTLTLPLGSPAALRG